VAIFWYNFFFDLTSGAWKIRGYSVGDRSAPDVKFCL
jgi:hypothetical protein